MLTAEVKAYLKRSVLCWLATSSSTQQPNVSPKELFLSFEDDSIIIANIASPQSVRNMKQNNKVCVSFIDILVQKGFQLKGTAQIITAKDPEFQKMKDSLEEITKGKFPFSSITRVRVEKIKPIIAPSYFMYPEETTEESQIAAAKKAYKL